jgi:hypothetical protein
LEIFFFAIVYMDFVKSVGLTLLPVDRHGADAGPFCGTDDAAGYFSAIGNQNGIEHGFGPLVE